MCQSVASSRTTAKNEWLGVWDRFWFLPQDPARINRIRIALAIIALAYFVGCLFDSAIWFSDQGPYSAQRIGTFVDSTGLTADVQWMWSPLFGIESLTGSPFWIHAIYLVACIGLCLVVTVGSSGRIANWLLWVMFAGWANRIFLLAGNAEILLSLGLFASAIAPPMSSKNGSTEDSMSEKPAMESSQHWGNRFALRLMAVQITIFGMVTWLSMLADERWRSGVAALLMASPSENRTFDWTTWLSSQAFSAVVTYTLLIALPIALLLAWIGKLPKIGAIALLIWCGGIAVLGSHWIYAATFGVMVCAALPLKNENATS